jgi:hypothetical protein
MKYIVIGIVSVLIVLCSLSPFFADDTAFFSYYVTPDVWIILDTSGSMTWDMNGCYTFGDGSGQSSDGYLGRDTDGDAIPNDSRLYIVKEAIRGLVTDPEIDIRWGLASFYQDEYWARSDDQYQVPNSGTYPAWDICDPPYFNHSRPYMWWHSATENYAYEAFFMRVQLAEGSPSHINNISSYMDQIVGSAPKKEFHAQGGTPIAGALRGVRYEYQSTIPSDNAKWCRGYYVILLSDGEPTYGIDQGTYGNGHNALWGPYNGSSPQWMKNQCYWEAESLMNTYIPPQGGDPDTVLPIKTYVIGIGNEGGGTLDTIAICGGTEHYYPATNPEELQEVLRAIISDIINQATSYSGAEVTSIQEEFITQTYEARMYLCSFVPSYANIWEGHCKAVKLITGTFDIDSIPDSLVYWDAGEILDTTDVASRTIYTEIGGSLVLFNASNVTAADLDVSTNGARDSIIETIYGGKPGSSTGYLGDIFHSTPLRIRGPNYFYEDDEFYLYRDSMNVWRDPMIYAGGNDGMIHCFNDSTGVEEWAFIPHDQLKYLKYLLTYHDYYIDNNPMAADIWFPTTSSDTLKNEDEWKTVLITGQRQGGENYTALNVSDPYNPDFLFNMPDSNFNFAETWSNVVMFKLHKDSLTPQHDRFFGFVGGGYFPDSLYDILNPWAGLPEGNAFYVFDIFNMCEHSSNPQPGIDYWKIPPEVTNADSMVWPFPPQPAVIDTNLDSYADILYMGDFAGKMWKVNLSGPDSTYFIVDNWEADLMFSAPRPNNSGQIDLWQPIFFPATSAWDGKRWWVYFGTGHRAYAELPSTINRFYAIIDDSTTYDTPITEADLKQVSSTSVAPLTEAEILAGTYRGWYYIFTDFDNTDSIGKRDGEKLTSFASILMDTLVFTTFQPYDLNDPCVSASGIARLYKVYYKSGDWSGPEPSLIVGAGLPQAPRYTFNISGEGMEIINLPGEIIVQPAPNLGIRRKILWWHETD